MEILIWIWVLTWMFKTAATDVLHAAKGTTNPRYELKKQKAIAAGKPVKVQSRYGTREWAADLYSDALVAHTERRRAKAAKPQPVDDMLDLTGVRPDPPEAGGSIPERPTAGRPPRPGRSGRPGTPDPAIPTDPAYYRRPNGPLVACGHCNTSVAANYRLTRTIRGTTVQVCLACAERIDGGDLTVPDGMAPPRRHVGIPAQNPPAADNDTTPAPGPATPLTPEPTGEPSKLATVIPMFPIMKESTMANAEITGLPTAIAFAEGMANAHKAASTAGGEQYVAALRGFEVGDGPIATVQHAREMSTQAAAAWERAAAEMKKQTAVKEAYQAVPDAGNKRFVTGE
ncbi:hypothetical protein [Micromonospora rubida]